MVVRIIKNSPEHYSKSILSESDINSFLLIHFADVSLSSIFLVSRIDKAAGSTKLKQSYRITRGVDYMRVYLSLRVVDMVTENTNIRC